MATARWMQERANKAWEDLENTVLDYITNIQTLIINVVMIIYRRSDRR